MSVHFISGKPGGGKTLYSVRLIIEELVNGNRPIVTNVPLNIGRLSEFLQEKYPALYQRKFCNSDTHISEWITVMSEDDLPKFFTFRPGGVSIKSVTNEEWKQGIRPDFSVVKDKGVFYVLDEVHIAFNARAWATTGHEVLYYLSQHRKLGDDVVCITQSIGNVDKQFRSVAQDFTYIKNLSKQKVGMFRLPAMFVRQTYAQPATDTTKPMESGTFQMDVSGIASCYDTARGVGIHGRAGADTNARKKGFHYGWFILGLIAFIYLFFFQSPKLIAWMTDVSVPVHTHAGILPTNAPVIIPQPVVPSAAPEILPPVASHQFRRNASETEPEIWCTGYTFFNGKPICMMSDGSEIEEQDGLQQIQRRFIIVAGRKIPIRAGVEPKYVPSPPRNYEAVARRLPPDPVNEAIILPTIHANHPGRDNYAPPSEMQGNYQN